MSLVHINADMPRADDAEQAVLGAVLVHNAGLAEIAGTLRAEHFGLGWCRLVYAAMLQLAKANQPIDFVTVKDVLGKALEDVGLTRLVKLSEGVPRATNVAYYADIVVDAARRRAVIQRAAEVIDAALEPTADADEVLTLAQESFFRLAQTKRGDTLWSAEQMTATLYKRLEAMEDRGHAITGLTTSLHDLDAISGGLQPGDLVVVGARPSVGKTALTMQLALHAGKTVPVLFCSLEMKHGAVWERALFNVALIDGYRFKRGFFAGDAATSRRIANGMEALHPLKFWLDDQPGQSSVDVRSKAQQIQLRHGLGLIVVDYLQLMNAGDARATRDQTRAQVVGDMAKDLKAIAMTLNVPVVVLSQLKRLEDGKRPTMADLRDSGDIEAHADIILLLHRVETREQLQKLEIGEPCHMELLVEKQRGNPTGVLKLLNYREQYRFESESSEPQPRDGDLWKSMGATA